jgi:protoheme IX farnesyltransferase
MKRSMHQNLHSVETGESGARGVPRAAPLPRRALYAELTKFRLSMLVVCSAGVGYLVGSPQGVNWLEASWQVLLRVIGGELDEAWDLLMTAFGAVNWPGLATLLAGVGLAAGGTSAINQWMETDRDRAMERTRERPLPAGRLSRNEAFLAGVAMIAGGSALVYLALNPLAGTLTLVTGLIYILIYTPMKARSTLNTLVGAVCGAIPPMIGWAAAANELSMGAYALAGILFIWQLPHFLALAWMYRDDYERGGFRMLPTIDRSGELTGQVAVVTSLLLIPAALLAALALRTPVTSDGTSEIAMGSGFDGGLVLATAAIVLGGMMAVRAFALYRQRTRQAARSLFLASIIYLPLLLAILVLDQPRPTVRAIDFEQTLASAGPQE